MTFFKVAQAKLPPLNIATLHGHYKHIFVPTTYYKERYIPILTHSV